VDFGTFNEVIKKAKAKEPLLFELEHDDIPTMENIIHLQKQYQITLPEKYIQFLLRFGGGYFGYTNIYSLDENSYFFIFNHNPAIIKDLLFIADNECGDFYAFRIQGDKCSEKIVFYDHEDNTIKDTNFSDVFEYLVKIGLNQL
jgi:SMI1 / KNR4 family.